MDLRTLLHISRPRFWLSLGGAYAVGFALGGTEPSRLVSFTFLAHFAFFLLPANLFLHGVNDYFDGSGRRRES